MIMKTRSLSLALFPSLLIFQSFPCLLTAASAFLPWFSSPAKLPAKNGMRLLPPARCHPAAAVVEAGWQVAAREGGGRSLWHHFITIHLIRRRRRQWRGAMEERMRIARDIITCMAKPLACSPARLLTHPLTLSLSLSG